MKKTRTWLALFLLLHVAIHPLLHVEPLQVMASGPDTLSAAVAGNHSQSHDCELCRISNSIAPAVEFSVPAVFDFSSPVDTRLNSNVSGITRLQLSARAPPTR